MYYIYVYVMYITVVAEEGCVARFIRLPVATAPRLHDT